MPLTNAQMLAVIAGGGVVTYRDSVLRTSADVPSDAQIAIDALADAAVAALVYSGDDGFRYGILQTLQTALGLKANASAIPTLASLLVKSQRVSTGAIGGGLSALVTLTWTVPFSDANYTVIAVVQDATVGLLSLSVVHIESISASAVVVRVSNTTVATPITGSLHLIAIHD